MEDAFVLAHLMNKAGLAKTGVKSAPAPTVEGLKQVVQEYQRVRSERVGTTVLRARKRAAVTHALDGFDITNQWYKELEGEDGTHIMDGMSKTILGAPKELDGMANTHRVLSDDTKPLLVDIADTA